jgi:hypothetical protein
MPSIEDVSSKLIELFTQVETASDFKTKSMTLANAKMFIFNEMNHENLMDFFVKISTNFEQLFMLNVWSKSLSDKASVEFFEPYEIIDKIFSLFGSLIELTDLFKIQLIFLINQMQDEQVKHLCIKTLVKLTKQLGNAFIYYYDNQT